MWWKRDIRFILIIVIRIVAAIVVAPTRELVLQIETVLKQLLHPFYWIVSGTLTGGQKKKSEKARLRKGAFALVRTDQCVFTLVDLFTQAIYYSSILFRDYHHCCYAWKVAGSFTDNTSLCNQWASILSAGWGWQVAGYGFWKRCYDYSLPFAQIQSRSR